MKSYLIYLEGQGDVNIKIVDEETWNWITGPRPKNLDDDETCPPVLRERFKVEEEDERKMLNLPVTPFQIYVGPNSYQNDRAFYVMSNSFSSLSEAMQYVKENDIEIADEFRGYIY